ncbi:hypothetical protein HDC33_002338 [Sporosarcina sp. JAI121]|nr:hypothetical protein [Sporosarcina sp. JAI121]
MTDGANWTTDSRNCTTADVNWTTETKLYDRSRELDD